MRPQRRAVLALGGGFALAGALAAPAFAEPFPEVPAGPTASVACVDRAAALAPVVDGGLGLTSIAGLPVPVEQLLLPPPVPTNPAIAIVTVRNPGETPFTALVGRDAEEPVPVVVAAKTDAIAAFEVGDGSISTFVVADVDGEQLAYVVSTSDCTPPLGWCDGVRMPDAPVAADNADICDGVFGVPG